MESLRRIPGGLTLASKLALLALAGVFLLPALEAMGAFADQLRPGCEVDTARFSRVFSAPAPAENPTAWDVDSGPGDACALSGFPPAPATVYAPDDTPLTVASQVIQDGQWYPAPVGALERLIVPIMGFSYALLFLALAGIIW